MKISAADVNKLRKTTGAGMMDCKKALEEAQGNFDKSIEILRKKGQKVAAKRADRDSFEGVVLCKTNSDNSFGAIFSLNCETDFVAMNDDFISLANKFLDVIVENKLTSKEEVLTANIDGITISEKLVEQTGVIGEKLEIGYVESIKAEFVGGYIHSGNKIASIVGISKNIDASQEISKDISMQIAAMNPLALNEEGVSKEIVEKEIEIAKEQLRKEGKPEEMLDNIAKGKIKKFYKENTLLNQDFIKDNKISIKDYLKSFDKDLTITEYKRYSLV